MTDEDLRELLAELVGTERTVGWRRAPMGYVRVLETSALAAGAERDHARAWVIDHGGTVQRAPLVRHAGRRSDRLVEDNLPGPFSYVIPERALSAT
jgi:hypothetical protein